MQNSMRSLHYGFAVLALVISLATYLLTVQPTVPFWDCGEFTAAAVQQQVPHPPGAPLFLMIGKVFHLLPFGDPGWRVNLVSVISSAITVLLLYLITVHVIKNFYKENLKEFGNAMLVYGSAFVGALAYAYSDTFWFNAVESEVYAASSLFVAVIVWLLMVWNEKADEPGHERYLLLIAYLIGLSIGVHLLSILTVFSIVLLIYLRRYQHSTKRLIYTLLIGLGLFFFVYNFIIMKLPALFAGTFPFGRNEAREYPITDSMAVTLLGVGVIALGIWAAWYGKKKNHALLSLCATSFLLLLVGYSTYAHILIRANANPPMNENKPTTFEKLMSYLGREQYGEAPLWPRRYQEEQRFITHYKKYGPWSPAPRKIITLKDGNRVSVPDRENWKTNTSAELAYMMDFQINHMYMRYFLWNFVGRTSDVQDAPAYWPLTTKETVDYWNHKSGVSDRFPVNFWMLPLLLGFVGLYVHFVRDKQMAWVFLVLFLMTGVLAAIQQNQQNPQPRERDYFYVSSFMVWAMWIGMGVFGLLERVKKNKAYVGGGLLAALALVPLNMGWQGWNTHTRANNYMAFDYAYNILQSLEKDAIVFTNGDNDTFPVWYLQDVAGVRRDVRVVNLSLGQTTWYIEQLKNREPFGAKKIPLSFKDEQLTVSEDDPKALSYEFGYDQLVTVPVDPKIIAQFTNDSAIISSGKMQWVYKGGRKGQDDKGRVQYFFGVQHKLVRDIIEQVKFTRPVYFSTSVGDPSWADEYIGLDNYLRLEGMAFRVCPAPQRSVIGEGINEEVMDKSLLQTRNGSDFSTEPAYGLKFRNLGSESNVYYDDVHRDYVLNYRNVFYKYATYLLHEKKNNTKAARVLKEMNKLLSLDKFPVGLGFELQIATFFETSGDTVSAKQMAERALASATVVMQKPSLLQREPQTSEGAMPEQTAAEACIILGRWKEAEQYYRQVGAQQPNDILLNYIIDEIQIIRQEREGNLRGALATAESLRPKYMAKTGDKRSMQVAARLQGYIDKLRLALALPPEKWS